MREWGTTFLPQVKKEQGSFEILNAEGELWWHSKPLQPLGPTVSWLQQGLGNVVGVQLECMPELYWNPAPVSYAVYMETYISPFKNVLYMFHSAFKMSLILYPSIFTHHLNGSMFPWPEPSLHSLLRNGRNILTSGWAAVGVYGRQRREWNNPA